MVYHKLHGRRNTSPHILVVAAALSSIGGQRCFALWSSTIKDPKDCDVVMKHLFVCPFEHVDEGVFGDDDVADASQFLLALRLSLQEFHLARDVPAVLKPTHTHTCEDIACCCTSPDLKRFPMPTTRLFALLTHLARTFFLNGFILKRRHDIKCMDSVCYYLRIHACMKR